MESALRQYFSSLKGKKVAVIGLGVSNRPLVESLLDAGHYATEQVVCPALVDFLQKEFPAVQVRLSEVHREVYESV